METFSGGTREEVWFEAIKHLQNSAHNNIEYNLIMEIKTPSKSTAKSKAIRFAFDNLLKLNSKLYSVNTVAETIFPASEYKQHGLDGILDIYPNEVYPIIKSNSGNRLGTYAYRIVRGIDAKGIQSSPLEQVIERLKGQLASKSKIRCAFELAIDQVETIPINRNDSFTRGFPCLSHLSFKLSHERDELHLTALYRSHDYVQKALGNLLGLARLQNCVARELGIKTGTLVCHSTLARLDKHKSIGKTCITKFIEDIER